MTTRRKNELCAIGFDSGCSFRHSNRPQEPENRASPSGPAKHDKPASTNPAADGHGLPKDWDDINAGHLVLAKDDGPWRAWWEAIPIEKTGDLLKLRWRDQVGGITPITRPRLELALICPDAA